MNRALHAVGLQADALACLSEIAQSMHWSAAVHLHGDSAQATQTLGCPRTFGSEVAGLMLLDGRQDEWELSSFLRWTRRNAYTRWTPVVVLCPSVDAAGIQRLNADGANAVVVPEQHLSGVRAQIESICRFWLGINQIFVSCTGAGKVDIALELEDQRISCA